MRAKTMTGTTIEIYIIMWVHATKNVFRTFQYIPYLI